MTIQGKRIDLLELTEEDNSLIVKWRNTERVRKYLFSHAVLDEESQKKWYKRYIEDDTNHTFIILVKKDDTKIGTVSLTDIDYNNKKAELSIIIGEEDYLKQGYAKEATLMIIEYAFEKLQLNKVHLGLLEYNTDALKMYEEIGFKREGIIRQDNFFDNKFHDTIIMSILKNEFNKSD